METSPAQSDSQQVPPRRNERLWGLILMGVIALALAHQVLVLRAEWRVYLAGYETILACQDRLCAVTSTDNLLAILGRGIVVIYFFLFALLERVPLVNVLLRVCGCVLFPVFGQILLPVTRCWIYMLIGAAAMAAGAQLGPGYGEYAFGGMFSAVVMLLRQFVLREKSPWEGAAWGLVSSLWRPGR